MYLASKTSVNMADIPTVLVLILVNVISFVEYVDGDYDYPWCPTLVEGCYCRRKYNTDYYIYCEYLGNLQQIPEFNQSDIMFKELHFRYDTRINLIQKDSFEGLMIENLWLQSLHITDIDRDAFVGLEDNLTHLHLGDNHITNIHRASIVKLRNLRYLGLHNNLMDSVPTFGDEFPELTYLYLFNNLITEIPSSAFRGMGSLKGLKLNNNEIIALRTGVFDPLSGLIDLELQGNRLATLPGNIFRNLGELKKLDLSHNRIHLLLTEAFYGLRSLETLHLNHNSLSEFQSGMFLHISRIKYLTLRNNYATSIEQTTFNRLRSIRTLDLSFNRISRIETKSFRFLYRLEKLYLSGNLLTHLDFFRQSLLGRIEILDVSNNNITQLVDPSVFAPLSKLEQLDLCDNALGTLDTGVFQELRLLKILKLAKNPLYVLEEGVLTNLSLKELDLSQCHLRQIHFNAFESIKNLNYLWLDNNELEDIPTRLFNNSGKMSILSLKHNRLTKLRRDMFKGLSKLEALHLDWNNLTNITEYSFVFLASLRSLTATHNQIAELYEHSFNDLKSLISLDLSHNKITSPGRGFTRFQNIQFLILKGNPMRNINWFSLGYITLQNLKFLDLSYCDIETIYLDGLILSLKTPLEQFELNVVGNPLSCSGCDLSWSSYIPYNSILNPRDVKCNTPNELKGRPAICSVDNPCLDPKMKNNSEIHAMCVDAEARLLAWAQTTMEIHGNLTTEGTYREDDRNVPTSSPEMNNSTQKMHTATVGLNVTKNYDTTIHETTNYDKAALGNESTSIHEYREIHHESTTMTTNFTDEENTEIDVMESETGSGEEVDKDFMTNIDNDTEYVDTKGTDDITHTDQTTIDVTAWRKERTSTAARATFLALLFTETIESTTAGGNFTVTVERHTTDAGYDSYATEDETKSNFEVGPTVVEGSQTTMSSQKFEEDTDVLAHVTVVTTDDTNKEQRDILQVKKNQTGLFEDEDEQSSGEIDKFSESNDKLFEEEQLMVVQNSNNPTSDAPNSLFSSGDPDNEIPPLNANEGERYPPDRPQAQEPESDDTDNVQDLADSDHEPNSPYQPNTDLSSYPFLEEIDDQNNDE